MNKNFKNLIIVIAIFTTIWGLFIIFRLSSFTNEVVYFSKNEFFVRAIFVYTFFLSLIITFFIKSNKDYKKLIHKSNTLKNIENIAGLGYWELDIIKDNLYWSDGVYDIFEIKKEDFKGTYNDFLERIHNEDREMVNRTYSDSLKNKTSYKIEHRIIVNDKIKYVSESCKTFYKKEQPIRSLGIIIDITKEKEKDIELLKNKNLDSLGIVVGGIAHNFNNIFSIIQGNLDLINTNKTENIENINLSISRGKELSKKMLVFSEGGAPIKKVINNFPDFVKKISIESIGLEKIELNFNYIDLKFNLNIDENMFKVVINNIIQNSIDAFYINSIEDKKINIKLDVIDNLEKCKYTNHNKHIKLSIMDNAGGMSKNCKEKVLLPYFTTKNENLGLGLTLVNSIVEKHEGHLEIQIEAYFGTSITIYLPILDEVSVKKEVLSVFNKKIEAMGYIYSKPKKMRVLIMDDEELILKMNKKFLEHNGYDVDVALHGKEAVEKYKDSLLNNNSFNAVILDLSIPNGMGGEETAKELLKIDDKCKLIVSSGYSNSDILSNYKDYGFIKSLPKPYKLEELLNIIDSLSYYE